MNSENVDSQVIRLRLYQKEKRLKTEEIANFIGVTPAVLYKIYQNKYNVHPEISNKIGLLLKGENDTKGFLFNERQEKYTIKRKNTYQSDTVEIPDLLGKIPYFDVDVTAGNVQLFQDNKEVPTDYYSVPKEIQDVDFCFKVRGDSMYDKILPGAIVFVKQISDISIIEFGQVFIVITAEQRMVKYVRRHPTNPEDMVLLRSHNDHYDDIDLPKNKITNLLLVKGYLNNYVL